MSKVREAQQLFGTMAKSVHCLGKSDGFTNLVATGATAAVLGAISYAVGSLVVENKKK
jgi:hypothetical protein